MSDVAKPSLSRNMKEKLFKYWLRTQTAMLERPLQGWSGRGLPGRERSRPLQEQFSASRGTGFARALQELALTLSSASSLATRFTAKPSWWNLRSPNGLCFFLPLCTCSRAFLCIFVHFFLPGVPLSSSSFLFSCFKTHVRCLPLENRSEPSVTECCPLSVGAHIHLAFSSDKYFISIYISISKPIKSLYFFPSP